MTRRSLDVDLLTAVDKRITGMPGFDHVESLVVMCRGEVFERYYRDHSADDLADTHSVTKSFTSALMGSWSATGCLNSTRRSRRFSSLSPTTGAKDAITVRNLLTMTSGLKSDGRWELCEVALHGRPWMEDIFDAPLGSVPGASFDYSNGAVHLLSAVIQRVSGVSVAELATTRLFGPLEINCYEWPTDPQGYQAAFGHLMITPRDLAKLGMLFLQRGRWEGASIVDAEYVAAATANQSRGGRPEGVGYGFLWWVDDFAAPPAYFAAGHGGQYVYVAPALDLVVVTTADAYASPPRFGRPIRNLIESYVVAAARNAR